MNVSECQQKQIIVVLGMPRSGTSAIARGLKALGISLGNKFAKANRHWNPTGFWEDTDIVYKINRGVLFALNYPWMSVSLIEDACFKKADLTELKQAAIKLIANRFTHAHCWGFKDPRTVKVLPFWQDVFANLHLSERYIIALRNPLASAYSYHRLSGVDIEVGLLLWLMHLVPAIQGTHGKNRIMVSYDNLMQNPHLQLERMQAMLHLNEVNATERSSYINEFLDKRLQHYEYNMDDLISHSATNVSPLCIKIYNLLMQLAADEVTFESEYFITQWQTIMHEFNEVYNIYTYIDKLLRKNKRLEKNILSLQQSLPWKFVYPFRIIDDFLRSRRKKARARRRLVKSYE